MKHIGIVGGMSPESTIHYYKRICDRFNSIEGGWNFPQVSIRSINLQEVADLFMVDRWDDMADIVISAIYDLKNSGADFAAIATNTPHNAYEKIKEKSPLEVLSIMDATASAIKKDGFTEVGLLGTKQTMEYGFFQRTFEKYGINTLVPDKKERNYVDRVIWDELVHGIITEDSKKGYIAIIDNLVKLDVDGVILGCTEIPLLVKQEDSAIKLYDTTNIHADAILDYAIES
jgi:aspartate racemase|tara:strand:- start:147 stop:839 length:693 start_codon:yes stop_codon:yes gene_type:complete